MTKALRYLTLTGLLLLLAACGTNPVTGKQELQIIGQGQELEIGRKQYLPARQSQGGDYLLDPQLSAYVSRVGQRLAAVSDRKLPYEFRIVNDSSPNAWALPGGKIAINRGLLLELHDEAELAAVLAHEIVHAAARHGAQGAERNILLQGVMLGTNVALQGRNYARIASTAAGLGMGMVRQKYGRDAEREADYYGMSYMARAGYDPAAAVRLQETFVRLFKDKEPNWLGGLFASHPPSQERVDNNRKHLADLKVSNPRRGRADFQRAIARLKKVAPAYEYYDKGMKALADGDSKQALALADKAVRIEPREALFYGLGGAARHDMGDLKRARRNFDAAIERNDSYFLHYLQRGLLRQEMGDYTGARHDLQRSLKLLPTANAHHALGRLAERDGDKPAAIAHYRKALSASGDLRKSAVKSLLKLDLPDNPDRYLRVRLIRDGKGRIYGQIHNGTPLTVTDVRLAIGQQIGNFVQPQRYRTLLGPLYPGQSRQFSTGIGPLNEQQAARLGVHVERAEVMERDDGRQDGRWR